MIKLELQKFGGRGATSGGSIKGNTISLSENGEKVKVDFNDLKKGDTFEVEARNGGTYKLKVGSRMNDNSYYVEGSLTNGSGTYIGSLVSTATFEKASAMDKQFMIPLSRTKNWKRK